MTASSHILIFSCPNRPGIVVALAQALYDKGGNIQEAHQYDDVETNLFFARIRFNFPAEDRIVAFREALSLLAKDLTMQWTLRAASCKARVLILVSRSDHCLADLLYRWRIGELAIDIAGIVSNHPELWPKLGDDGLR